MAQFAAIWNLPENTIHDHKENETYVEPHAYDNISFTRAHLGIYLRSDGNVVLYSCQCTLHETIINVIIGKRLIWTSQS